MNKAQSSSFTIGVQYGSLSRKLESFNNFRDETTITSAGGLDRLLNSISPDLDANASDLNVGVLFKSEMNEAMKVSIGFSMQHLGSQQRNNFTNERDTMPGSPGNNNFLFNQTIKTLSTLHGELNAQLTDKLDLTPAFIARFFGPASEYGFQAIMGYKLSEKANMAVRFGAGYRLTGGDAAELFLGVDMDGWRIMGAYDLNTSDLSTVSGGKGGFELAAQRIFTFYKKPKPTPVFLCPKYY